jgi:hypothetical protein
VVAIDVLREDIRELVAAALFKVEALTTAEATSSRATEGAEEKAEALFFLTVASFIEDHEFTIFVADEKSATESVLTNA